MVRRDVKLREEEAAILRRFDALRPIRKDKDLAAVAGLSQEKMSNVRRGIRKFTVAEVKKIEPWLDREEQGASTSIIVAPDIPPTRLAGEDEVVELTRVDLSFSMGPGTEVDDYVEETPVRFDLAFIRQITRTPPDRLRLARGIGDSMFPTLLSSDNVMIDTTQRTLNLGDRIYAISLYGAAAIKRLRPIGPNRVLVVSDNPAVADQEIDAEDLVIAGRIIWFARDL